MDLLVLMAKTVKMELMEHQALQVHKVQRVLQVRQALQLQLLHFK